MGFSWREIERNYVMDAPSGVVTASTAAAGYPASNLRDYAKWRLWRAGGTGGSNVKIDFGAGFANTPDTLALINCNFTAWGLPVTWASSPDDITYTTRLSIAAFGDAGGGGMNDGEDWFYNHGFFGSFRYWKLTIPASTAAPQIGMIVMGRMFEYPDADIDGYEIDVDYQLREWRGESGQRFIEQVGPRRLTWKIQRSWLKRTALQNEFGLNGPPLTSTTLELHQGALKPMVFIPRPDAYGNDGTKGRCYYARWQPAFTLRERVMGLFRYPDLVIQQEI